MVANKVHYRHLMLFFFRKGKNATQAANKICAVYGEGAVAERTVRKWFARFKARDFDLEDQERPGRPSTTDEDLIKTAIENNPRSTTPQLAEMLNKSNSTIHDHIVKLGYINRLDVWVPHLTEKNLMDRISICDSLYKRNEETPFLKQLVTGDEKWIIYKNVERNKSWGKRDEPPLATPKAGLHPKKVMLCVWWDWKGILYYELLPNNETINSEKYCLQLDELKTAIEQKRPELANRKGVVFHQDNARPHVSLTTRQKLLEFGWDVLTHPAYSPDLAPSDFHLFRSLQNSLNGKNFNSLVEIKNHLENFFAEKPEKFWKDGILKLHERWNKVVEQNGTYII